MDTYISHCLNLLRSGRPVIVFDLETTGLFADRHNPDRPRPRAWEIGAIRRTRTSTGVVRREGNVVIDVGPLPVDLIAWNAKVGIVLDPLIATREGKPAQVCLPGVARSLAGAVLVGHNLTDYDAKVLAGDFVAAGLPVPVELRDPIHHVDTLRLAQILFPSGAAGSPPNHRLATMAKFVGYDTSGTAFHRALDDSRATEAILIFLVREAQRREARAA